MKDFKTLFAAQSKQFVILLSLLFVFTIITVTLYQLNDGIFFRFFKNFNPLTLFGVTAISGSLALTFLLYNRWFDIHRKVKPRIFLKFSLSVLLFVAIAIFVDLAIVFPQGMNILLPESLLFYPAIAFLVEMLFHVLPLAVLMIVLNRFLPAIGLLKPVWIVLGIVALLEPSYQVYMDDYPLWAAMVVWVNLYLFNWVQLVAFKQYGFILMLTLRLVYYLFWHIIWGSIRLDVLF
ncbi:hypothetical protein MWU78_14360 [Arenibacter sp. F26102]|uniref:hypothetical protein n=1 Tax=Arenibacter sp. F26102 TaxID=2926416 RepID=UPI001FF3C77C|nr:hypothetical protein [Arenibacter sp. F26102]MCK0146837.1 hypothetical protein [Arenibacter sp. F26102]